MSLIRRFATFVLPATAVAVLIGMLVIGGCDRGPSTAKDDPVPAGPTEAVRQLIQDLSNDDLPAYARHALPPGLHRRMEVAWSEGRTIWPLTELPLDDRLPAFISVLAAPEAEKELLAAYNRQFAGADRELRSAAATLGLFAGQYVQGAAEYSDAEREHYLQLIAALSEWGRQAPLGDPERARRVIPSLVAAARTTGLAGPEAFARNGMERSLTRLGPFFSRMKQVLAEYGLDLDASLAGSQATLIQQTGDTARVSVAYEVSGRPVVAEVLLERLDGRWYLTDLLRHAEAEAGPASAPAAAPAVPAADPAVRNP